MKPSRWVRRCRLPALLAAAALAGCVDYVTVEGGTSVPVVLAIVVAGEDSVFLSLGRSGPGIATASEGGATLVLETPDGDVPFVEVDAEARACGGPERFSCYVAELSVPFSAGQTARMRGTLASGAEVRGTTLVPPVPPVTVGGAPPGGTVRWVETPGGVPGVALSGGQGRVAPRDSTLLATWWRGTEEGTCPVSLYSPHPFVPVGVFSGSFPTIVVTSDPVCDGRRVPDWDSLTAPLVFLGYDAHATLWAEADGGFWPDAGGRGVEGAVGVFGSAAQARFQIHVTASRAVR